MLTSFIILCAHDNYEVSCEVNLPADVTRSKHNLDGTNLEQMRHDSLVVCGQGFMIVTNAVGYRVCKGTLIDMLQERSDLINSRM